MKRKYRILLFLIGLFILIPIVKADNEEYAIYIDTDNSVYLCRADGNSFTAINNDNLLLCISEQRITDTDIRDSVFTYDSTNKVLSLKQSVHYAAITSNVDAQVKITSGDNLVYLNNLHGINVRLENLSSESYTTTSIMHLM